MRVVIYARVGRGKVDGAYVVRLDRAQMKGVLPWLVRWACHAGTRDFCSALTALVGPSKIFFFLIIH
jgi:hypothetical protein